MEDNRIFHVNNGNKSFFYQTSKESVTFFNHIDGFTFNKTKLDTLKYENLIDKKYPLFVDMKTEDYPFDNLGLLIIFSSCKPGRFKEITKNGYNKLMPTWSYEEMSTYIMSATFGCDHKKDMIERQLILEKFETFGGAMRSVINNDETTIQKAIEDKGKALCDRYFTSGHGGMESTISDVLIHRNPPKDKDGKYLYEVLNKPYIYSFASHHIFTKLVEKNKEIFIKGSKLKFVYGTYAGVENGKQFEWFCLHIFKCTNRIFTVNPLDKTKDLISFDIEFTESADLVRNWKIGKLSENVLYLPTIENLEAGDAFCVMKVEGVLTLIVLQITISGSHPVKINGLETICKCYANANIEIKNKILIFVTPVNGKLTSKQKLTTTKGIIATKIPEAVGPFCNNQFKIEYDLDNYTIP
jgi:hypothetical protein